MLVAARLRHISATTMGNRKYMNTGLLEEDGYRHYLLNSMIGNRSHRKKKIRKILYTTPET